MEKSYKMQQIQFVAIFFFIATKKGGKLPMHGGGFACTLFSKILPHPKSIHRIHQLCWSTFIFLIKSKIWRYLNSICCHFLFHNNKKGGKLRMHGGGFACGGSMSGHQSLLSRSLLHLDKRFKAQYKYIRTVSSLGKLGSVTGPIIQDNGRMTWGQEFCFTTKWISVCTGLADCMVTLWKPGDG